MGTPNKIRVGQSVSEYPAGTHNWLVDGVSYLLARREESFIPPETPPGRVLARIKPETTIDKPFGVQKIAGPLNDPNNFTDEPLQGIRLQGGAPEEGEPFVILQRSASDGQLVSCILDGETWARVDIKDIEDTVCGAIDGDTDKLESGAGAARILWKPAGTGVKTCLISLAGGGAVDSEIISVWLESDIDSATYDIQAREVSYGEGQGYRMVDGTTASGELLDLINGSKTEIRASTDQPIILECRYDNELEKYKILSDKDLRSLPNWGKGNDPAEDQMVAHSLGGAEDWKATTLVECP